MALNPRIPATFTHMLIEHLQAHEVEPAAVLPMDLSEADSIAPEGLAISHWIALLDRAAIHLNDPCLGLHVGQRITPRHLGPLGYLLLAMPNLGAALDKLNQYQRLVYDLTPMKVRSVDDGIELVWDAEHGRPGQLSDDTVLATLVQFARDITAGPQLQLSRLSYINPPPLDRRPYEAFFECPVDFDQPETVLRIAANTLFRPLKGNDPGLTSLMETQVRQLMASLPASVAGVSALRQTMGESLHLGEPTLADMAAAQGLSARTLQRQLAIAGTSFNRELAAVRQQMAEAYLADCRLTLSDVAQLLGYSEHSAFTRRFRATTGCSPKLWRQRLKPE